MIPLKSSADGKSRLASVLSEAERAELVRVMAAHVVEAASATPGAHGVHVLAAARDLVPRPCEYIADGGAGLNAAVTRAARELRAQGAGRMLILHGDLPFVTPDEIGALVRECVDDHLVAAPDVREAGTNALAFSLSRDFTTRFGPGSLEAHRLAADAAQMPFRLVRRSGLAHDIDEPRQLQSLIEQGGPRYAFLRSALRTRTRDRGR